MTNTFLGAVLFMAIASTGTAVGAVIGVKRNGVDVLAPGNAKRLAVLGIVATMSWLLFGLSLKAAGLGEIDQPSTALMGAIGMVVGILPVLFAINSQKVE